MAACQCWSLEKALTKPPLAEAWLGLFQTWRLLPTAAVKLGLQAELAGSAVMSHVTFVQGSLGAIPRTCDIGLKKVHVLRLQSP